MVTVSCYIHLYLSCFYELCVPPVISGAFQTRGCLFGGVVGCLEGYKVKLPAAMLHTLETLEEV